MRSHYWKYVALRRRRGGLELKYESGYEVRTRGSKRKQGKRKNFQKFLILKSQCFLSVTAQSNKYPVFSILQLLQPRISTRGFVLNSSIWTKPKLLSLKTICSTIKTAMAESEKTSLEFRWKMRKSFFGKNFHRTD